MRVDRRPSSTPASSSDDEVPRNAAGLTILPLLSRRRTDRGGETNRRCDDRRRTCRTWAMRAIILFPIILLSCFGILHIILLILGNSNYINYNPSPRRNVLPCNSASCQSDPTVGVKPIPCHSHNDYWRAVPLFDALHVGCMSVEADIWLPREEKGTELLVGHSKSSLGEERTLKGLYVGPIERLLDERNKSCPDKNATCSGIFSTSPNQTLVLMLDFKEDARELLPYVNNTLDPLRQRNYLSFHDGEAFHSGPLTVVLTGNAPTSLTSEETQTNLLGRRDLFYDAPLSRLSEDEKFNSSNSYYASTSLKASVGNILRGSFSTSQLSRLRSEIRAAKEKGLRARFWDTPSWPTSLRNYVWQTLMDKGVDVLNVDDLQDAAFADWKTSAGWRIYDG